MERSRAERDVNGDGDFDGDPRVFRRILRHRIRECRALGSDVIRNTIMQGISGPSAGLHQNVPVEHFEFLMKHHFQVASNKSKNVKNRRESWEAVRIMLSRVDEQVRRKTLLGVDGEIEQESVEGAATVTTSASTEPSSNRLPEDSNSHAKNSRPSSRNGQISDHYNRAADEESRAVSERSLQQQLPVHPALRNGGHHSPPAYQRHSSTSLARAAEKASRRGSAPIHPVLAQNGHHNGTAVHRNLQNHRQDAPVHPILQQQQHQQHMHPSMQQQQHQYQQHVHPSMQQQPEDQYHAHPNMQHQQLQQFQPNLQLLQNPSMQQQHPHYPQPLPHNQHQQIQHHQHHQNRQELVDPLPLADMDPIPYAALANQHPAAPNPPQQFEPPDSFRVDKNQSAAPATVQANFTPDAAPSTTTSISPKKTEVQFPHDPANGTYSGALRERAAVVVQFRKHIPDSATSRYVAGRLCRWDPFWKVTQLFSIGATSPIDKVATKNGSTVGVLKTAASIKIPNFSSSLLNYWGKDPGTAKPGHKRLLVRMLPLELSEKSKKKRADCHIWPKGTYLTVNGRSVQLRQRKQQSHDHDEWKGLSYPFDLAQHVTKTNKACDVSLVCYDEQQYVLCIALCEYVDPISIVQQILTPGSNLLDRLSLEQSKEKARAMARQQAVSIDIDTGGQDTGEELGRFVFSVFCPIKKTAMVAPVRGKYCKHFQCFDLEYFILCNVPVYGGRWRCASPSCDKFVSYKELQFCSLTEHAINTFRNDLSAQRNRVEFCEDGTFRLLPAQKLRYGGRKRMKAAARSNGSTDTKPALQPAPYEEIVID